MNANPTNPNTRDMPFPEGHEKRTLELSSQTLSIPKTGYLEIILGPMFSGKTTQTIQIYNKYKYIGKKVFVINYIDDTRYDDSMLSSHDQIKIPCIFISNLTSIYNEKNMLLCSEMVLDSKHMHNADVIIINEGQFFPDLFDIVLKLVEKHGKKVYICGLDGDYKQAL